MKARTELGIDDLIGLYGGNPGALQVVAQMAEIGSHEELAWFQANGIRGPLIWVCFKDLSGGNLESLLHNIARGDEFLEELRATPDYQYEMGRQ